MADNQQLPEPYNAHAWLVQPSGVGAGITHTQQQKLDVLEAEWDWREQGGSSRATIKVSGDLSDPNTYITNAWEIILDIRLEKEVAYTRWYRGVILDIKAKSLGGKTVTTIYCGGYWDTQATKQWVDNDYTAGTQDVQTIVKNIVDVQGVDSNTRIVYDATLVAASTYTPTTFDAVGSASRVIRTLSEVQGSRTYNVDPDNRKFQLLATSTTVAERNIYIVGHNVHEVDFGNSHTRGINNFQMVGRNNAGGVNSLERGDATDISSYGKKTRVALLPYLSSTADLQRWADNKITDFKAAQQYGIFVIPDVQARVESVTASTGNIRLYRKKTDGNSEFVNLPLQKVRYKYGLACEADYEVPDCTPEEIRPKGRSIQAMVWIGNPPPDLPEWNEIIELEKERITIWVGQGRGPDPQAGDPNTTGPPTDRVFDGQMTSDTTNNDIYMYDSAASNWKRMGGQNVAFKDEANAFTQENSFGSQKLTGVADPTAAQDVATKAYVDAVAIGIDWKPSVRIATTANITLSGTQTIDGVAVIADDRVLVKDQTAGAENGLYCVDPQTEILTKRGFKRYDETIIGEDVFTLNLNTGKAEWQPVISTHVFPVNNIEMMRAERNSHSSLSTMNHRWPVYRRKHRPTELYPRERYADGTFKEWDQPNDERYLTTRESHELTLEDYVPICADCSNLPTTPTYGDALVELIGWFITEGHIRRNNGGSLSHCVRIYQSLAVNSAYVERIRTCLITLFGEPTAVMRRPRNGQYKPEWRECITSNGHMVQFCLNREAGKKLCDIAPGRVVNPTFITSLTKAQLNLFVDTCISADGCRSNNQTIFVQKRLDMLAPVEMACALLGIATSVVKRSNKSYDPVHTMTLMKKTRLLPQINAKVVKYSGVVWCPKTANSTWLARRAGTVYFTGNTVAAGAWTRTTDANTSAEVTAGVAVFISEGTANGNRGWILTTNDPITLGTTALVFTQFLGPGADDHGQLTGLADDDHAQYLRTDGTRALTGNMAVNAGNTVDGRDISVDGTKLDTLVIGSTVQAYDATLQSLSALGTAADKVAYTTAIDTWAETTLTTFARTILDDTTAAAARTTLDAPGLSAANAFTKQQLINNNIDGEPTLIVENDQADGVEKYMALRMKDPSNWYSEIRAVRIGNIAFVTNTGTPTERMRIRGEGIISVASDTIVVGDQSGNLYQQGVLVASTGAQIDDAARKSVANTFTANQKIEKSDPTFSLKNTDTTATEWHLAVGDDLSTPPRAWTVVETGVATRLAIDQTATPIRVTSAGMMIGSLSVTPAAELHLYTEAPQIRFQSPTLAFNTYDIRAVASLEIYNVSDSRVDLRVSDAGVVVIGSVDVADELIINPTTGIVACAHAIDVATALTVGTTITATGDINAAGGFRKALSYSRNYASTATGYTKSGDNSLTITQHVPERAGSVMGISAAIVPAIAAGQSITLEIRINTVAQGTLVCSGNGTTQQFSTTYAKDAAGKTFSALQPLEINVLANTSTQAEDIVADLWIES